MGAGRPPKPTKQKELEGTARKDRTLENEMMPSTLESAPSAPKYLSAAAKKEWKSICEEFVSLGMLHRVDLALLSSYCNEMSMYIESCEIIRKEGFVMKFDRSDGSTYSQQHPAVSIKNSALANALKLANQFGLTPAARARLEAPEQGDDAMTQMMKRLQAANG